MKKSLVILLTLAFILSTVCTAFAAANPFVDVPAKHWAYESVAKLVKAGIVDGYGDGTFRGDRTLTRYEMAVIVAKAMANQDKADASQKAEIAKLQAEFSDELTKLGVRVAALEDKVGNIKFTAQVRTRYEWNKTSANEANNPNLTNRLIIWTNAQLDDNMTFTGRYVAQGSTAPGQSVGINRMDNAFLTAKVFGGGSTLVFGRQPCTLGKGLIYNFYPNNDGVSLTFGNEVKVTGAVFKHNLTGAGLDQIDLNVVAGNVDWTVNKDFDITAAYARSKNGNIAQLGIPGLADGDYMKYWALGFGYTGIKNINIIGEYAKNTSDAAKALNHGSDAKGWISKVKYLGADNAKPKSWGFWVGYRKADGGFLGHTGDSVWETNGGLGLPLGTDAAGNAIGPVGTYLLNNVKGFDYGFEYTLFKNGIFTLQYQDFKDSATGNIDAKNFSAQVIYYF